MTAPAKAALRRLCRERRAALARGCADFAQRLAAYADSLGLMRGDVVAGYWPVRDEADPRLLMEVLAARGHTLALPRIERGRLYFHRWRDGDALVDNRHGIPEPRADSEIIVIDVVLVPLLAFDAVGHRLGYGGGYYDRMLATYQGYSVGIAYSKQEVEALPRESHDHPLDDVLTENGLTTLQV